MAGNILLKELTSTGNTITSTGASTTQGTATSAGTVDFRSGGTSGAVDAIAGYFELTSQWATTTSIVQGSPVADLYLVPAIDGTNFATIDSTSGASYISGNFYAGTFINALAMPSTSTNYRFATPVVELFPSIYTVYIINRSGQTISVNWTLKFVTTEAQYT